MSTTTTTPPPSPQQVHQHHHDNSTSTTTMTTWPLLTSTKSLNQNNIWLLMAFWPSLNVTVSSAPSFDIAITFDHLTLVDLQHKWPLVHQFTWSLSWQPIKLIQHSVVLVRLWLHPKSSLIQMLQMGCRAPPESHYRPHLLPERSTPCSNENATITRWKMTVILEFNILKKLDIYTYIFYLSW